MLTAVELAGFKSFADKTRFEFPDGITVIVGPNGSGKSNVVDAVKWVLGAQSAKALRGKEMTDVIFKGSSSTGRKPCNSAEATLVFDNAEKRLDVDSEEVHVTRRVYRSGEGEYLINNQPCRLKDIRNLFRGTGVGVDAYSLIEQGKVDRMLQASPKDRRVIFEEAAGISRFNAKKVEAARRLDRVEQNLTRLKDIVDEVHTRLSRLKTQATKAQKYREMTSRLRELRTRIGWTEYSELREKLESTEAKLQQCSADLAVNGIEVEETRDAAQQAEMNLHGVAESCQAVESRLQETLQSIAVFKNQQRALQTRVEDNAEEERRHAERLIELRHRVVTAKEDLAAITEARNEAQLQFDQVEAQAQSREAEANRLRQELALQNENYEQLRSQHIALLKELSDHNTENEKQKNLLSEVLLTIEGLEAKVTKNETDEKLARQAAQEAKDNLQAVSGQHELVSQQLVATKEQLATASARLVANQEQAALTQGKLSGAAERLEILEELEMHFEGVDAGARNLIDLARENDHPAFKTIHGLVAELLMVKDVDLAGHIDTALGTSANIMIVEDGQLTQYIRSQNLSFSGRLSLLRLDRIPTQRFAEKIQLDGVQGVVGRADKLVRCKNKFMPLVRYLLGATWVVENLDDALSLSHFRGAGLRFVTTTGELIEADGTLTLGANQSSSGLISRRSELRNARSEIEALQEQHARAQKTASESAAEAQRLTPELEALEERLKSLSEDLVRQQAAEQSAARRLDEIEVDAGLLASQLVSEIARRAKLEPLLSEFSERAFKLENQVEEVEQKLKSFESQMRGGNERVRNSIAAATETKVELARQEEKLDAIKENLIASQNAMAERAQAVADIELEITRLIRKRQTSELEILELTSQLAETYLRCELEESQLDELAVEAAQLRAARASTAKQFEVAQRDQEKLTQISEAAQIELGRHQESSQALLKRFTEDYEISFEHLSAAERIDDSEEYDALDQEASQLRQDISSVGEINMAALAELDELQERFDYLNGQYEDLEAAKESLHRIIQKINSDSRRMFSETLQIIRQNFQKLYRKSFGGGSADILLEEGDDVLDCGIDIIATPPGKTALSNSLLSGGEKALTAVALLLAIFQYRPSPFCVLDEVDAPFDEANIGRFVSVLHEFLDWTKFIVVTHSKKTMTAATTLYGVTMQESGVSKQVAVRFEDVNEKGEIRDPDKKAA